MFTRFNIEKVGGGGRQTVVAVVKWGMGRVKLMLYGCHAGSPNSVLRYSTTAGASLNEKKQTRSFIKRRRRKRLRHLLQRDEDLSLKELLNGDI